MNLLRSVAPIALLALFASAAQAQASTAQKLASLKNLRDTGVISEADYQQRIAALKAGQGGQAASAGDPDTAAKLASLKNLRDTGVLTQAQYQQRVAALRSGAGSGAGIPSAEHQMTAGTTDPRHLGLPTVPHTVNDAQWGLPWGTVKLPPNWTLTGQVVHAGPDGCSAMGHSPLIVMESPDKAVGFGVFPVLKSQWLRGPGTNMQQFAQQGCFVSPSTHAVDFIARALEPKIHPNMKFQVIAVQQDPGQEQTANQIRQMNAQMAQYRVASQFMRQQETVEPARVFIRLDEGGGRRSIEMYTLTYACHETLYQMNGMPGMHSIDCTAYNLLAGKMPDDGTDPTQVKDDPNAKLPFSVQQNPQWARKLEAIQTAENNALAARNQATSQAMSANASNQQSEFEKRQKIMKDMNDYRSGVINNTYASRTEANNKAHEGFIGYISDTQVLTNPNDGQRYRVSNQYNNTYFDPRGNVLQTNSAYSPGVDWSAGQPQ